MIIGKGTPAIWIEARVSACLFSGLSQINHKLLGQHGTHQDETMGQVLLSTFLDSRGLLLRRYGPFYGMQGERCLNIECVLLRDVQGKNQKWEK